MALIPKRKCHIYISYCVESAILNFVHGMLVLILIRENMYKRIRPQYYFYFLFDLNNFSFRLYSEKCLILMTIYKD